MNLTVRHASLRVELVRVPLLVILVGSCGGSGPSADASLDGTTGLFSPAIHYQTGGFPSAVAVGDLNADGKPDLAVANFSTRVSVLLNNGDGTFAPEVIYAASGAIQDVALGDLNGDGKPELVVNDLSDSTLKVLVNNGDGTFAAPLGYPAGPTPFAVVLGDLDGDGVLDAATANIDPDFNMTESLVTVLLNSGDGTLSAPLTVMTGTPYEWRSMALGDFNGDDKLDLAVVNPVPFTNTNLSIFLNNGGGILAPKVDYVTGGGSLSLGVGDVNRDGRPDVAVVNSYDGENSVSMLLNSGDGTFGAQIPYPVGNNPSAVTVSDLDNDGLLDLAVANSRDDNVSLLINLGDGTFAPYAAYGVGNNPVSLVARDLDGDGRDDLVAVNGSGAGGVSVLIRLRE